MNELAMRGTRIGSLSYETDRFSEPAERVLARYRCPQDHDVAIPFSTDAEDIPLTWTCRCGLEADAVYRLPAMAEPAPVVTKHVRSHWDMLLERRTIADLEELLAERLQLLHQAPLAKSA
jgi:hypothetical protein